MHDAVHPTGEPGENGKGSGTTLGTAKKCLTPLAGGAHGVPRQAARSGSNTGQEAHGGPDQLAGKDRRGWVRWDGRNRHLVGSEAGPGALGRRGRGPGPGRTTPPVARHRGPRVTEQEDQHPPTARHRDLRVTGQEGRHARRSAPGPPGPGARGQAPPAARHRGPRVTEREGRHRRQRSTEALGSRSERVGTPVPGTGAFGPRAQGIRSRRSAGAEALGSRWPKTGGARCRRSAPGRRRRQLATVGPEELARATPPVTRGHHRFSARVEPPCGTPDPERRRLNFDGARPTGSPDPACSLQAPRGATA